MGINLLREGLDLAEVALVAILDAGKEGFLRSTRALIQTIGRAARNINGKAVLYAENVTQSMQRAIDETERRREKQEAPNIRHGILPATIEKRITEFIDGVYEKPQKAGRTRFDRAGTIGHITADIEIKSAGDLGRVIDGLEKQMYDHARALEFEQAAQLRDSISELKKRHFTAGFMTDPASVVS